MSMMSRLMGWIFQLPPAETHDVGVQRDLQVPMPDGITLLTDHYAPRNLGSRPTLLMRSVYMERTRAGWTGELFAERGFHVLMQSGRGTAGSGGTLDPFQQEYDDGLATLEWLKQQDWFNGELAVYGASYPGFTAWATACAAGPRLRAMSTQITSADFRSMIYPGDALALEVFLHWMTIIHTQEQSLVKYLAAQFSNKLKAATFHLPLVEADVVAFGKPFPFWGQWLSHEQGPEPDGCLKVKIDLSPTAYHFRRGHCIRLQVSSGSFPRWNRNLGSDEPLARATTLRVAQQQVYHDPDHLSAVILPMVDERQADQEPEAR